MDTTATALKFTITARYPNGTYDRSDHDLADLQAELGQLARVLDALVVGEVIEIKRTA